MTIPEIKDAVTGMARQHEAQAEFGSPDKYAAHIAYASAYRTVLGLLEGNLTERASKHRTMVDTVTIRH